jgi:hypothetical protein
LRLSFELVILGRGLLLLGYVLFLRLVEALLSWVFLRLICPVIRLSCP